MSAAIPRSSLLLSLLLGTACVGNTNAPNAPPPPALDAPVNTPPDPSQPVQPTPTPPPASGPIAAALQRVPDAVAANYLLSISGDRQHLTIDPKPQPARRDTRGTRGFSVEDSANGGKIVTLAGGPFRDGAWVRASFRQQVQAAAQLDELRRAGYDLDQTRDLLVVQGEQDQAPTVFAFSADARKPGIVGICSQVTIIDFGPGTLRPIAVRKPVVYLYPETTTDLRVRVDIDGDFLAVYPPTHEGAWNVTAEPDGALLDRATGRRHRYLFWEGTSAGFTLDPARAHCVPRGESAAFLERACSRFALTDLECGDLVTYWLPALAKNPYNLIQFVDEDTYGRYARLTVEPRPDAVIRPFLIFRGSDVPVAVGAPELPQRARGRFTLVEWGGADLDAALDTRR